MDHEISQKEITSVDMTQRKIPTAEINKINYLFLLAFISSFLTLPFIRIEIIGYLLPIPMIIVPIYFYFKFNVYLKERNLTGTTRLLYLLLFFFTTSLLVSVLSNEPRNWRNFYEIIAYAFLCFIITFANVLTTKHLRKLLVFFEFVILCLSVYGIAFLISGKNLWFQFTVISAGPEGKMIGSRNVDAYLVLAGVIISLNGFFWNKTRRMRLFHLCSLIVFSFAIIASLSRSAFFSMGMFYLITLFISFLIDRKRTFKFFVTFFALAVILIFSLFSISRYSSTFDSLVARIERIGESERLFLVEESFYMMIENPATGIGLGNYKYKTDRSISSGAPVGTAHNSFLNFGAEAGILAFIAVSLLIFLPFFRYKKILPYMRRYFKANRSDKSAQFLFSSGFCLSILLVSMNIFNVFLVDAGYIFWLIFILCLLIFRSLSEIVRNGRP
jgi:O-antigen ligase